MVDQSEKAGMGRTPPGVAALGGMRVTTQPAPDRDISETRRAWGLCRAASRGTVSCEVPRSFGVLLLICLWQLVGCGVLYRTIPLQTHDMGERQCSPRSDSFDILIPETLDQSGATEPDGEELKEFSPTMRRVSTALGIETLLSRLVHLERKAARMEPSASNLDRLLVHHQMMTVHHRLLSRLVLASHEVERVTSTIRCEYAKTREMWDVAQIAQDRRSRLETTAAVMIAGIGTTAAGVFGLADLATGAGVSQIVGGTLGAILGTMAVVEQVGHEVDYPLNIVVEVWSGTDQPPPHIPRSVWRLLTDPREEQRSLRDLIIIEWQRGMEELGETEQTDPRDLIFVKGVSGLEALRVRTTMLEVLSANLDLIKQDIELALRTIITREPMAAAHLLPLEEQVLATPPVPSPGSNRPHE
jgi:hypothetical protein